MPLGTPSVILRAICTCGEMPVKVREGIVELRLAEVDDISACGVQQLLLILVYLWRHGYHLLHCCSQQGMLTSCEFLHMIVQILLATMHKRCQETITCWMCGENAKQKYPRKLRQYSKNGTEASTTAANEASKGTSQVRRRIFSSMLAIENHDSCLDV